ncbi:MAG: LysM peptidoglycan-binding domain-containing protein [Kurthia sp.]|nr:LysM peptidoglycan-binding domain-containing protein [Candidatus Kurthia equi]
MKKKSLIASLTLGTTIVATTLSGGFQASAMADDGSSSNAVVEKQLQQKALHYAQTSAKNTTKQSPVRTPSNHTYIVKSGDTLSSIASKYQTTYQELMKTNNLKSTDLSINQQLKVSTSESSSSSAYSATSNTSGVYEVKQGDTLSGIASDHGTSYTNLMNINGLNSTLIYPKQQLKVTGSSVATSRKVIKTSAAVQPSVTAKTYPTTPSSNSVSAVKVALNQIGTPYVSGGNSPSQGFDCSGLVYYSLNQAGKGVGRSSAANYYSLGVSVSSPKYGDLVFFSGTYKSGISHVGFYIGGGNMVSASGDHVQIDNIYNSYWKQHLTGFKRL